VSMRGRIGGEGCTEGLKGNTFPSSPRVHLGNPRGKWHDGTASRTGSHRCAQGTRINTKRECVHGKTVAAPATRFPSTARSPASHSGGAARRGGGHIVSPSVQRPGYPQTSGGWVLTMVASGRSVGVAVEAQNSVARVEGDDNTE
jgi:hypothetical protein